MKHQAIINGRRITYSKFFDLIAVVNEEKERMSRLLSFYSEEATIQQNKFEFYSLLSSQLSFRSVKTEKEPAQSEDSSFELKGGNENFQLSLLIDPLSSQSQPLIAHTVFLMRVLNPKVAVTLILNPISHLSEVFNGEMSFYSSSLLHDNAVGKKRARKKERKNNHFF